MPVNIGIASFTEEGNLYTVNGTPKTCDGNNIGE